MALDLSWARNIPKRLLISYILDWIIIVALVALSLGLHYVEPYKRPFSLLDLSLAYPYIPDEQIPTTALALLAFVMPVLVILVIAAIFIPGKRVMNSSSRSKWLWLKLWEMEQGWAGLCLSLAASLFITQCTKNLFGKPRPDMLARCNPDLANVAQYVVGGYGQPLTDRWVLVSADICQQTDSSVLANGFRSFPSGHSSFSWAGLLYLTLWLCSKFRLVWPAMSSPLQSAPEAVKDRELLPYRNSHAFTDRNTNGTATTTATSSQDAYEERALLRSTGASAPLFLFVPALVPIAIAVYICSTRYVEFYHFGFDIISGSLIGIVTAYISFRWYHLPLSQGRGWAWGPRSRNRAFIVGVGTDGWIDGLNSGEAWTDGRRGAREDAWNTNRNGNGNANVRMEGV